jgi:DNA repair protein RecN (Recombination protein N)
MLVEISVENLAIIERSQLSLGPGFTVLTGETGAGKSLVVDAIELVLGERADSELVRSGASRASVSAVFDLSNRKDLLDKCAEMGISLEDKQLFIQREVFAEGRSQCRVAGKLTPLSQLRQLGQSLVDLHGQHDHQSLLDADRHVQFLDDWIGHPAFEAREGVRLAFEKTEALRRKLHALRAGQRDREQRLDLLRYQIDEIEAVGPREDEMVELETLLARLKHAEKLTLASASSLVALKDDEVNATDLLGRSLKDLEEASRYDPSLESVLEPLRSAVYSLEEGVFALRSYSEEIASDPEQLEITASRIDALKRLRRKYGDDETAILAFLEKATEERDLLENGEENETDTAEKLAEAEADLKVDSDHLTTIRQKGAKVFADLTQTELHDLAMEKARFDVHIAARPIDANGGDRVDFFFSANLGEPPKPLSKIASGGEISRVMLAIKTAMAGRAGVPTLVFDEVDTGLGGRSAAVVARKIQELAEHYQVVVVSHLPQIAGSATSHYRVEKAEINGRAVTHARALDLEERVEEIARMIAGEQVSESARTHAREMLTS